MRNNFEIKSEIYTVTIGRKVSNAKYYLNETEFLEYLENLNKEYKNDGSSSKFSQSQDIYNLVEQSDEYEIYSKRDQSLLDY